MNKDQVILEAADILSKAESLSLSEGANFQQLSLMGKIRKEFKQMQKVVKSDAGLKQKQSAIKKFAGELQKFKSDAKKIDDATFWSHIGQWWVKSFTYGLIVNIVARLLPGKEMTVPITDDYNMTVKTPGPVANAVNAVNGIRSLVSFIKAIADGLSGDNKSKIRDDTLKAIDEMIKLCNSLSKMSEKELAQVADKLKAAKKKLKTTDLSGNPVV